MKTVILSARNRISGMDGDCFVNIGENILRNDVTYKVSLKWFHMQTAVEFPTDDMMYMVIDGFDYQDTYCSIKEITPFAIIDTRDWVTMKPALFYPRDHSRLVRVSTETLHIRLVDCDTLQTIEAWDKISDDNQMDSWTMELHFIPLTENEYLS